MSKIKIILILFIICFSCNTMAQKNKKKLSKDTIEVSSNIDSFVEVSEDSNKDNEIDSLKKVISILKSEIREQVELNQHLKDRILFADSCFLRVSNDCLRKKYDNDIEKFFTGLLNGCKGRARRSKKFNFDLSHSGR